MTAPDRDLLARLQALYGRDFLRALVSAGEEARRLAERAPPHIVATIQLRGGRCELYSVDCWRPPT